MSHCVQWTCTRRKEVHSPGEHVARQTWSRAAPAVPVLEQWDWEEAGIVAGWAIVGVEKQVPSGSVREGLGREQSGSS